MLTGGYISWFDPESKEIWQAINRGNGLEFRSLGSSPGGFSLRQFVDMKTKLEPILLGAYTKGFAENKLFGNTAEAARQKSSEAGANIWEEDIKTVSEK